MPRTHGTARLRRNRGAAVEPAAQAARPEDYPVRQAEVLNRELSWLEFNARVLHEAMDPRTPLLERVRFLGIFTSNLDEFFMKRVGGLKRQLAAGVGSRNPDRMSPAQQLAAIRSTVARLQDLQAECFRQLRGELDCAGVHLIPWDRLTPAPRQEAEAYFRATVFPILTPLAVDPGHPFPFISNLSESLGVVVRQAEGAEDMFARI
jgi:polyphosphate kinase